MMIMFTDEATAFDGLKKALSGDKGIANNRISTLLYTLLERHGIPTTWSKPWMNAVGGEETGDDTG